MATAKTRAKILKTFLTLLEDHPYEDVTLTLVADTAKVKLSDMRAGFSSKLGLVEAFLADIDATVLDERDEDMGDQPPRDRLFDVLMTRIDAFAPYKAAVRTLRDAAKADPGLALEFNRLGVRSQGWMLTAAGIEIPGLKRRIVAQGLAVAFGRVLSVWLDEADEGMPRTMAKLDRELENGVTFMGRLNRLERFAKGVRSFANRRRRDRDRPDEPETGNETEAAASGA